MIRDVVIGLDLATRTGFAVLDLDGKRLESGTWPLSPRAGRGKPDRWVRLRTALLELLSRYEGRIGVIACERPFEGRSKGKSSASTPKVAWGLVALVELTAEVRGLTVVLYPPKSCKLVFARSGNADKAAMVAEARRRWPAFDGPHDEADGLAVAVTALAKLDRAGLECGEVRP